MGEPSRGLRQCVLILRRCFLSDSAFRCEATVAHRKHGMFVRISAIRRGVVVSKNHSVPGEGCLMLQAGPLQRAGVGAACHGRQLVCLLGGHSRAGSATAGIALLQTWRDAGPELRWPTGYPPASAASIRAAWYLFNT